MSLVPMEFPVDQFIECIRNNRNKSQKFLEQTKSSNTGWIYEIIKIAHNTILETKQLPNTKLNALLIIRDLMEQCKVPSLNLIEVYILPIVYEIAVQKAKEKGDRKGSKFFQQSNKGSKIPNIQETGIKFMALCSQILVAGSIIKPKRLFLSQELRQKSEFAQCFQKYKNYDTQTTSTELSNLQNFSSDFKSKGRYKFLKDLESFNKNSSEYSQYFVTKMIQSVQSDNNPLFNMGAQSVSSIANDLDMRKLLKYGDPIITSPLIDELILKLNTHPNFMAKKNCLSLITDFIKWGDSEAFVKLCNNSPLDKIGLRIAQVDGRTGMTVGQDIYPQVKGQRDGKRKFYTQYLKSIQIISKCLGSQKLQIQQAAKIEQLYNYFKDQKKYVFPQNLMTKRIQSDFKQNLSYNEQRNIFLMKKLKLQGNNEPGNQNKKVSDQTLINQINKNMEECIEQMMKVTTNEKQVDVRMTQLRKLKDQFQEQIYKLGEVSNIEGQEVDQILENGQQVSKACQKIQQIYKLYKNKSIGFKQFKERHENLTQQFQFESQYSVAQSDRNKVGQNAQNMKNSLQDVVNSFKISKGDQNFIQVNQLNPKQQIVVDQIKKQFKIPNQTLKQTEEDVLNQITSSIVSKKSQKQRNYLNEPSRISQSQNESGSKFSKRSKFISKESNYNDQQYKLNQPKKSSFQEQSGIYKTNNFVKVQKRQQKQPSQYMQQNYSNMEYVDYNSPESLKIQKNYQTGQNFILSSPDTSKNIYISTNPINLDNRNQQGTQSKLDSNQNQSSQKNSKKEWNQYGIVTYKEQGWRNSGRNSNSASICKNGDNQISKQYFDANYNNAGFVGSNGSQGFAENKQAFPQKYKQEQNKFFNMQNNLANNSNASILKMKPEQSKISNDSNKMLKKQMSNSELSSKKSNFGDKKSVIDGQKNLNSKINKEASVKSLKESENMRLSNQNYRIKYQDSRGSQRQNLNNKSSKFNEQYISEIKQPNYYSIASQIEEDFIKEPKLKPLEQSYYRPEDIENQLKQCQNPQFKDCFKIEKQMIRSPTQKANIISVMQSRARSQTGSMNEYNKIGGRPHEEYLINKIRRQHNKQSNLQNVELSKRILNLKDDNSRLRNQMSRKQRQVSSGSRSNQFSECVQFSRSKQHSKYVSPFKSKASNPSQLGAASRVSAIAIQGQPISQTLFSRYLLEVNQDKIKKACLKNKSLILKTDIWQIGTMLKQSPQSISITLYLTPNCKINNFSYTISSQPNLQLDYLSKQWSQIPENKQIKIQIDCALKNINYDLPLVNIYFGKGLEKKNVCFYLPLTINKFVIFGEVNMGRIGRNLIRPEIIRRTEQFQINKKVLKTNNITQIMPLMTKIEQEINKKLYVYATTAIFNNEQFQLLMVTKGNEKVVLQALVENSKQNNMADYLLYTFKKLIQK